MEAVLQVRVASRSGVCRGMGRGRDRHVHSRAVLISPLIHLHLNLSKFSPLLKMCSTLIVSYHSVKLLKQQPQQSPSSQAPSQETCLTSSIGAEISGVFCSGVAVTGLGWPLPHNTLVFFSQVLGLHSQSTLQSQYQQYTVAALRAFYPISLSKH